MRILLTYFNVRTSVMNVFGGINLNNFSSFEENVHYSETLHVF